MANQSSSNEKAKNVILCSTMTRLGAVTNIWIQAATMPSPFSWFRFSKSGFRY